MKRSISGILAALVLTATLAACSSGTTTTSSSSAESSEPSSSSAAASEVSSTEETSSEESSSTTGGDFSGPITVISREPGSGTRGAFIELFGIEVEDEAGNKTDTTTENANIANSTNVILTQVASDPNAIGYVSLGSLNDTVKALNVDGAAASAENIKNGTYKVSRPFNIATKGEPTGLAKDFIDYIMSAEGQEIVSDGYIKVDEEAAPFAGTKPEGSIVIAGSSSVTPVMEKLKEGYQAINAGATIEIQQSDSSAGMQALIDGTCDIGMASRELKDTELESLTPIEIALDGIAVVVNNENPLSDITSASVKDIYTGVVTDWSQVQ